MQNEELQKYLKEIKEITKSALNRCVYLPIKCDYDCQIKNYSRIDDFHIEEFVLEYIGKEYGTVYADSHSFLKGCYKKDEIGTKIFCDQENAQLALDGKDFEILQETKELQEIFEKLEEIQKQCIDTTLFCVLSDSKTEKYQVVAMQAYNIMISCIGDDKFAFNLSDTIGNFTAVLNEMCFTDSEQAFNKAKELNEEK